MSALLVVNKGDCTLSIIDPGIGKQLAAVPVNGVTGHEVIASLDGKTAYVAIYGDSGVGKPGTDGRNVVAIDIAAGKICGNVDFGHGVRPHCVQVGPKDGLLYVSAELDHCISIVDAKALKVMGSVPTGQPESHMFVITSDGRNAYTANVGPGTVSVLDLVERTTLKVIPISSRTQRISISVDDERVFTCDQTAPGVAVIDTARDEVGEWIDLPGLGYGSSATPDGRWLVVTLPGLNQVAIVDIQTMRMAQVVDVPKSPQAVVCGPDGTMVYVSSDASAKVSAIRTSDWKIDSLIEAGNGADGLAWAQET